MVLSCIPKKSYTVIKRYSCGSYQDLLGKGESNNAYGKKTTLPVKTKYTFKYYNAGTKEDSLTTTKEYKQNLTIATNPFSKPGYVFTGWKVKRKSDNKWYVSGKGWKDSAANAKIYNPGETYNISNSWVGTLANTEFHFAAQWKEAIVTISYNSNGGTGTMDSHTTKYNEDFNIKSNQFEKTGYKFIGWVVKRDSDSRWYVSGRGWFTQKEIDTNAYKKKVYGDSSNNAVPGTMNDTWFGKKSDSDDKYVDKFIFYAKWEKIPDSDELIINKVYQKDDGTYDSIMSPATFNVYNNSNCTGDAISIIKTTSGSGSASFNLGTEDQVKYYVKEVSPPMNYDIDETCYPVVLKKGENTEIQIVNRSNCRTKLDNILELNLDHSSDEYKNELIKLYNEYGKNNLLNFESPSCEETTSCYTKNISCLSGNYELSNNFNENNLTCFNNKITNNDGYPIAFCSTTLNIKNNLELDNEVYSDVLAGQVLMYNEDDVSVATSSVSHTCYFIGNNVESEMTLKIPVLKLSGTTLIPYYNGIMYASDEIKMELMQDPENDNLYVGTENFEYYLPKIYAKHISGKIFDEYGNPYTSECLDCKYLGRGIASQFNSSSGNLGFEYLLSIDSTRTNIVVEDMNSCPYKTTPKLITYEQKQDGELQVEFRTIDTNKPFERDTKTNWCSNEEGVLNCGDNNNLVNNVIKNATNSNGLSINGKQNPIYKIKLTPNDIVLIREYNKSAAYDNYSYECIKDENDNITCKNKFLDNLMQGKIFDPLNSLIGKLSTNLTKENRNIENSNNENVEEVEKENEELDKEFYETQLEEESNNEINDDINPTNEE